MGDQMTALRRLLGHERRHPGMENKSLPGMEGVPPEVVAVASGKGGVGKTLCAAHLAAELSRRGLSTVLVEGDLRMANLHLLFDRRSGSEGGEYRACLSTVSDLMKRGASPADHLFSPMPDLRVVAPAPLSLEEHELAGTYLRKVLAYAKSSEAGARFVVVDAASGMPPESLQLFMEANAVIVLTTAELASITDAYALTKLLLAAGAGAEIGLLPSMVSSRQDADELHRKFNLMVDKFLNRRVRSWGFLPLDKRLPDAAAHGELLWEGASSAPYLTAMAEVADHLCERFTELAGAGVHVSA